MFTVRFPVGDLFCTLYPSFSALVCCLFLDGQIKAKCHSNLKKIIEMLLGKTSFYTKKKVRKLVCMYLKNSHHHECYAYNIVENYQKL